jgi:hypothetical protein
MGGPPHLLDNVRSGPSQPKPMGLDGSDVGGLHLEGPSSGVQDIRAVHGSWASKTKTHSGRRTTRQNTVRRPQMVVKERVRVAVRRERGRGRFIRAARTGCDVVGGFGVLHRATQAGQVLLLIPLPLPLLGLQTGFDSRFKPQRNRWPATRDKNGEGCGSSQRGEGNAAKSRKHLDAGAHVWVRMCAAGMCSMCVAGVQHVCGIC